MKKTATIKKEETKNRLDEKIRQQINAQVREVYVLSSMVDDIRQRLHIREMVAGENRDFFITLYIKENLEISIEFGGTDVKVTYKTKEWYKELAKLLFHMYNMLIRLDKKMYLDQLD